MSNIIPVSYKGHVRYCTKCLFLITYNITVHTSMYILIKLVEMPNSVQLMYLPTARNPQYGTTILTFKQGHNVTSMFRVPFLLHIVAGAHSLSSSVVSINVIFLNMIITTPLFLANKMYLTYAPSLFHFILQSYSKRNSPRRSC